MKRKKTRRFPVIHEPGPWAKDVETANDRDRLYFETHPGEEWYVRERVAGEGGPVEAEVLRCGLTHTLVRCHAPGIRTRSPISPTDAHDLKVARAAGLPVIFPAGGIGDQLAEAWRKHAAEA